MWILIWVVATSQGVATNKAEFSREITCQKAAATYITMIKKQEIFGWAYCASR